MRTTVITIGYAPIDNQYNYDEVCGGTDIVHHYQHRASTTVCECGGGGCALPLSVRGVVGGRMTL